ncbi:MAG: peptidoglycan editing factor PgeF [Gammaproteobacteria bacterium]
MTFAREKTEAWVPADWPAPGRIHAGTSTRRSGYSLPPFDSLNLALLDGDDTGRVLRNRRYLRELLALPDEPVWLQQVHGNRVLTAPLPATRTPADGIYTNKAESVCAVLTADCVPLLLCHKSGTGIAAVHVGWRGLCRDIIENAIKRFSAPSNRILAWIGPHIGAEHYEVGKKVRNACIDSLSSAASEAFTMSRSGHWFADLNRLVRLNLVKLGVSEIYSCGRCSYREEKDFYSYRRDRETGRMASLIWMDRHSID